MKISDKCRKFFPPENSSNRNLLDRQKGGEDVK